MSVGAAPHSPPIDAPARADGSKGRQEPDLVPPRHRTRRIVVVLALIVAAVIGGWFLRSAGSGSQAIRATGSTGGTSYGRAVRADLTQVQSLDGTLAYTSDTTVVNRLGGASGSASSASAGSTGATSGGGTLTWQASEGALVGRGGRLYTVDVQPVSLLYGTVPAWRTLQNGVSRGRDVLELERNLKALGFDDGGTMTVDNQFTSATTQAVIDWQRSIGANADGVVDLGEVIFLRHAVRVDQQLLPLGSEISSGTQVLEVGATSPVVTVDLSSDQLSLLTFGTKAQIDLPDGTSTTGIVTAIGGPASSSSQAGSSGSSDTTPATFKLVKPDAAQGQNGVSVTVNVVTDQREAALAVPITALLALQGGGYAVQIEDGHGHLRLVKVSLGLFDDSAGLVEVTSGGVQPGDRIVVASS